MLDLGKYAGEILMSYAIGIALIAALLVVSIINNRKVRAQIQALEEQSK